MLALCINIILQQLNYSGESFLCSMLQMMDNSFCIDGDWLLHTTRKLCQLTCANPEAGRQHNNRRVIQLVEGQMKHQLNVN